MSNSQDVLTVLFQGASGSGKSQLISWHMTGKGQEACKTLEENYEYCETFSGRKEQVNFLDTSGDAECAEMMEEWVSKANAQILLINLEDATSLDYLHANCKALADGSIKGRVLVGNLPSGKEVNRVVPKIECLKLATALFNAPMHYVEVNTRNGAGVATVFNTLMECVYGLTHSGAEPVKMKTQTPPPPLGASESKEQMLPSVDKDEEIRLLKTQQAVLEAKLEAMTARFEALEARQRAEEKAAAARFEAMEVKVSEASLTQRIEELLLSSLKRIGWSRGASPPKSVEVETPPKVRTTKHAGRGQAIKQSLFSPSSSVP